MPVSTNSIQHTERPEPKLRKPYQRPKLEVYGNIREITKHVGNTSSNPDPPPHSNARFSTR